MSTRPPYRMALCGFDSLNGNGLLVPHYRPSGRGNMTFRVVPSLPGDPEARVKGFAESEAMNCRVEPLRRDIIDGIEIAVGDPILHALSINGNILIGTVGDLTLALKERWSDIVEDYPLSLLSIFGAVEGLRRVELIRAAVRAIDRVIGEDGGVRWLAETFLPAQTTIGINRELAGARERLQNIGRDQIIGRLREEPAASGQRTANLEVAAPYTAYAFIRANQGYMGLLYRDLAEALGTQVFGVAVHAPVPSPDDAPIVVGRNVFLHPLGRKAERLVAAALKDQGRYFRSAENIDLPDAKRFSFEDLHASEGKSIVITVVDESDVGHAISELREFGQIVRTESATTPVIVFPILPDARPSVFLGPVDQFAQSGSSSDAVVDTSFIRSPIWWGQSDTEPRSRLLKLLHLCVFALRDETVSILPSKVKRSHPIIGMRLRHKAEREKTGRGRYISEAVSDIATHYSQASTVIEMRGKYNDLGRESIFEVVQLELSPDLRGLTHHVLEALDPYGRLPDNIEIDLPPDGLIHYDQGASVMVTPYPQASRPCIVTLHRPNWESVRAAAKDNMSIVRYTDTETLETWARSLDHDGGVCLPVDYKWPSHRTQNRRRFLIRSGDLPPTLQAERADFELWRATYPDHPFARQPRLVAYRAGTEFNTLTKARVLMKDIYDYRFHPAESSAQLRSLFGPIFPALILQQKNFSDMVTSPRNALRIGFKLGLNGIDVRAIAPNVVLPKGWALTYGTREHLALLRSRAFRVWCDGFRERSGRNYGKVVSLPLLDRFPVCEEFLVRDPKFVPATVDVREYAMEDYLQLASLDVLSATKRDAFVNRFDVHQESYSAIDSYLRSIGIDESCMNDVEIFEALCDAAGLKLT